MPMHFAIITLVFFPISDRSSLILNDLELRIHHKIIWAMANLSIECTDATYLLTSDSLNLDILDFHQPTP